MNRGHVLQSMPMQEMIGGSRTNWWNISNNMMMRPAHVNPQQQIPSTNYYLAPPPNSIFLPHYIPSNSTPSSSSSSCHESQDQLPESWSQFLLGGGVVGGEDKSCITQNIQEKKLENWEDQLLLQHHNPNDLVKQENSSTVTFMYGQVNTNINIDHHHHHEYQAATMPSWSQVVPVDSSPKSCVTTAASNLSPNMLDFSNKSDGKRLAPEHSSSECISTATGGPLKKARVQPSSTPSTFKVRKEKLGDRVTALHQLVSPFGKTDTASVLLEAIGYIRFLQNQVEALSIPYLGNGGANTRQQHSVNGERNCLFPEDPGQLLNDSPMKVKGGPGKESVKEPKKDLRTRGLCLVPISCTLQVGSDNGADYWAQALGGGFR